MEGAGFDVSTEQWRCGREGRSPERRGMWTGMSVPIQSHKWPARPNYGRKNVWGKVRQFECGQNKKALESQTMEFTRMAGNRSIQCAITHSSSRIKIVPKNDEFSRRMQDEQEE